MIARVPAAPTPTAEDQPEPIGSEDPEPPSRSAPAQPDAAADTERCTADTQASLDIALVLHTDETDPPLAGWLDDQLRHAARLAGVKHAALTLAVVGDEEMAELHEQYTGVPGTTDVLTFDLAECEPPPGPDHPITTVEGDIVVCLDEAQRQAKQRAHPVHHELLLYAVHGLLHLLGEDDHNEADYQRMHAREDELLEALGIGRLFNGHPQPPTPNSHS